MSSEPLVFLSAEPAPSETDGQESDCADGACAIPSRPEGGPVAMRTLAKGDHEYPYA